MLSQRIAKLYIARAWGVKDESIDTSLHSAIDEFDDALKKLQQKAILSLLALIVATAGLLQIRLFKPFWSALSFRPFPIIQNPQPRGVTEDTNYMMKVNAVTEFDVITDAYSVYKLLQSSPLIDGSRIGVMGFSYGDQVRRE